MLFPEDVSKAIYFTKCLINHVASSNVEPGDVVKQQRALLSLTGPGPQLPSQQEMSELAGGALTRSLVRQHPDVTLW